MQDMFSDEKAYREAMQKGIPIIYEFYKLSLPKTPGDLLFGKSTVYPGKVGTEYYMTKGHIHSALDTAEVYYCLRGNGCILMEDQDGNRDALFISTGTAVYVPGKNAHRIINTGSEPLVSFFAFRADAGHDYSNVIQKGYGMLVDEHDGI